MSIAQDLDAVLETAGQPLARQDRLAQRIAQEWIEPRKPLSYASILARTHLNHAANALSHAAPGGLDQCSLSCVRQCRNQPLPQR